MAQIHDRSSPPNSLTTVTTCSTASTASTTGTTGHDPSAILAQMDQTEGVAPAYGVRGLVAAMTRQRDFVFTRAEAESWLRCLGDSASVLALYAHFFPNEWANTTAACVPLPGEAFSPREQEFYDLVDQRFFPLDLSILDGMNSEDRFPLIPYETRAGVCFDDPEGLRPGYRFLCFLLGLINADQAFIEPEPWHSWYGPARPPQVTLAASAPHASHRSGEAAETRRDEEAEPTRTASEAEQRSDRQLLPTLIGGLTFAEVATLIHVRELVPVPLIHEPTLALWCDTFAASAPQAAWHDLDLALRLARRAADNPWTDCDPDADFEQLTWDIPMIENMRENWQEAMALLHRGDRFCDWLEEDFFPHAQEVLHLWLLTCLHSSRFRCRAKRQLSFALRWQEHRAIFF